LANPELGAKQICPTCSSKFYDLGRRPAHCPKCGSDFDPEEALRSRRVRPRGPLPEEEVEEVKPVEAEAEDDGFEAEAEEAPELDEGVEANRWKPPTTTRTRPKRRRPRRTTRLASTSPRTRISRRPTTTRCRSSTTTRTISPKTRSTACRKVRGRTEIP
jgi:uncharacterized protein (TIGR02300 family)